MASDPLAHDRFHMAVALWLGVGLTLGAIAYGVGRDRLPLGLAGALVAGSLGAIFGATAQSLLEGSSRFHVDSASVAGSACGAALLVVLLARAGGTPQSSSRDVR